MADKLLPCPFCGGEAYIEEESDSFSTVQYVARCKNCLVEVRIDADLTKSFEYNRQKVTEAWNYRPSPWHIGTPTEEGWYLIKYKHNGGIRYIAMENPSKWVFINDDTLEWQKINEGE